MAKRPISAALFILIIGTAIILHEGGHFLAARWQGIAVKEMSVGFGPELFSFSDGQTNFILRLLPLGGFADILHGSEDPRSFDLASDKARALVLAAGALMNLLTAFLLLTLAVFLENPKRPLLRVVLGSLAITITAPFVFLYSIFTKPGELGGVVSVFRSVHAETDTALTSRRWTDFIGYVGTLNLGLFVLNILPIPTLDGGRLLFVAVEHIAGQRQLAWEQTANIIGGMFVLFIVVFLNARDIFFPPKRK